MNKRTILAIVIMTVINPVSADSEHNGALTIDRYTTVKAIPKSSNRANVSNGPI